MATSAPNTAERPQRADARRNRELIVAAARAEFLERGSDASLDAIARRAGVGIGTLYRHFPTRHDLLDAVFRDSADVLCARADELRSQLTPRDAFVQWMRASLEHAMSYRGLAAELMAGELGDASQNPCADQTACANLRLTAEDVVARAKAAGVLRDDIEPDDVVRLVNAIALTTEGDPDATAVADRLFAFMVDGLLA
jgi:AcrR family transcriptional regulator